MHFYSHVESDAMLCRVFCLRFGRLIGGEVYFDEDNIVHILPSIMEVPLSDGKYSCHILNNPKIFYFRRNYCENWEAGNSPPPNFSAFSQTAKDYVGHNCIMFRVLISY